MITNLREIRRRHENFLRRMEKTIVEAMDDGGKFAQQHVRQNPRGYKHRTGRLIQATKHKVVKTRSGVRVVIKNTRRYAKALDRGARPHIIRPRRKKFLRFMGKGGDYVFARSVRHPGMKPTRFLWRATNAAARVAFANVERDLTRQARRF